MSQPSETVNRTGLFHRTNLINILVMHLLLSAYLVVVMNTEDMGSTHRLLTTGRCYQQSPGRCKRVEGGFGVGGENDIMCWLQYNNVIREGGAG